MSLKAGSIVYYNGGVAIVYASYPTTNEVVLKFLNKNYAVVTNKVTSNGITLATSVSGNNKIIENIQTKSEGTIRNMLLKLNNINIPKPQQSTKTPSRRIMPSRKSVAEMIASRYSSSSSSSSDEDSDFDITKFKEANGRRSRRRISIHHKKSNRRQKSNRHHKKSNRRQKSNRHKMHPRKK
jgi:hypothetical protein